MAKKVFIYGLRDPRDGRIKYVGQTRNFASRVASHMTEAGGRRFRDYPKNKWLNEISKAGLHVDCLLLETCSERTCVAAEQKWIEAARESGETYNVKTARRINSGYKAPGVTRLLRFTKDEIEKCEMAAFDSGLPLRRWAIHVLVREAENARGRTDGKNSEDFSCIEK